MPKTKISEFSATPGNNTDIDGINIAEGCAPSGINDAIRELMAQLKDFQAGTAGDSFNGPVGTSTAAAGAFTTLSSTGNTTLGDASGDAVTINGATTFVNVSPTITPGTANGVAYLNGSKVLTTGSALVFDGTNLGVGISPTSDGAIHVHRSGASFPTIKITNGTTGTGNLDGFDLICGSGGEAYVYNRENQPILFGVNNAEQARLTSTGLGIGTSSPAGKLHAVNTYTNTSDATIIAGGSIPGINLRANGGARLSLFTNYATADSSSFVTGTGGANPSSEVLRLDHSGGNVLVTAGNLGIGTNSPGFKLQVIGTSQLSLSAAGTQQALQLNNSDTTAGTQAVKLGFSSAGVTKASINAAVYGNDYMTFNVGSDTERMRLDSSGNLLVGGTTSYGRLTTYGNLVSVGDGPDAGVSLRSTSGRDSYGLFNINESGTASALGFYWIDGSGNPSTGTERMRLDSSGNLGLGVTPSAWDTSVFRTLQVGTGVGSASLSGRTDSVSNIALGVNFYYGAGAYRYIGNGTANYYNQQSGVHSWHTAPSGTAGNAITFTQAMTLDASGNLGVGTTSPTNYGGGYINIEAKGTGTSGGVFTSKSGGGSDARFYVVDTSGQLGTWSNIPMLFYTNSNERARITSGGDLLVGTTSAYGGPGRINVGFNQSTNFGITLRNTSATATGVFVSFENSGGTGNGSISQTNSTTVAYNTSSDRRLKKNIVSAPQAGADIDAIQVVSHGWVSNDDTVKYGVIAQDLAVVAPLAVTKGDDGDEIERVWGVDYSKLVPMLIKEVQALRARVAALESNP